MLSSPFSIVLPEPNSEREYIEVKCDGSLVIIGANGAGKTKLGRWLELDSPKALKCHRISAQKSLSMPQQARPDTLDRAEKRLMYGHSDTSAGNRVNHRWHSNPDTFLLDDFESLMVYLHTEHYEQAIAYKAASETCKTRISPPVTKLDTVKRIWEEILPQRRLKITSASIQTVSIKDDKKPYHGSAMSDGERVIFYLLGQAVAVPKDTILIVDEPELHVHTAIQAPLWDKIEAERPDCLFVYITHDVEFAATRVRAKKICLREYKGPPEIFDWFEVPSGSDIPEETLLKILGSRKEILFVEGDNSSLDYFTFQHLFPEYTVVPRGGCDEVIQATNSFNASHGLHYLKACGLIDRDQRSGEELNYLRDKHQVFCLRVATVENLFLTEDAVRAMAAAFKMDEPRSTAIVRDIQAAVFKEIEKNKDQLVSNRTAVQIERRLKKFDAKAQGQTGLANALTTLVTSIDVKSIYGDEQMRVDTLLSTKKYNEALAIYSNKGLVAHLAGLFGLTRDDFLAFAKRIIQSDDVNLLSALRKAAPSLPSK